MVDGFFMELSVNFKEIFNVCIVWFIIEVIVFEVGMLIDFYN